MQPEQNQNYWQPSTEPKVDTAPLETSSGNEPPVEDLETEQLEPISWQASEYVHQEKDGVWFLALLGVAVLLLIFDYFVVKSWTFGVLIVVMAVAVMVMAKRPPRTINYTLLDYGFHIDNKQFNFHDFRAFGVVQEGAFYSIRLIPVKRFMPMVSIFFPPEHGETIVDAFGDALPMEDIKLDTVDRLAEKIRF